MLIPIPGFTHLKYLIADPIIPRSRDRSPVPREVSALVRVALDSAYGLRPVTTLHPKRFDAPVRAHIAARRKLGGLEVAKLMSCHIQISENSAEVCGSIALQERRTAYAARLVEADGIWKMLNFRVF
ncbi:Rv3235 family protein [Corynebacterium callunae]|uniref:Rv3235 family protein n=1 Tax=Corynebacterium callunae TaxID=1721 RepID=UPI003981D496